MLKVPLRVVPWVFYSTVLDAEGERVASTQGTSYMDHEQVAQEMVQAVNLRDEQTNVLRAWLEAVQNSMSLRLALAGLPEGAGPVLVEMLQDVLALAKAEGESEAGNEQPNTDH